MPVTKKMNFQLASDKDLKASSVKNSDDYGGMNLEEFSRRIQADSDARNGDVIRNASWEDVGEAGW